jgi:hypothetical protein
VQVLLVCTGGIFIVATAINHVPPSLPICEAPQNSPEATPANPIETVPLPPGLREAQLTVEEAEKIREILDDPAHPTRSGKAMPVGEASILRKTPKQ